jgi:hypothetical protein
MSYSPYKMKGAALYSKGKKPEGKENKKTLEDYLNEGFSQKEAEQMLKDGATTGDSAVPFIGKLAKGIGGMAKKAFQGGVGDTLMGKNAAGALLNPGGAALNQIGKLF